MAQSRKHAGISRSDLGKALGNTALILICAALLIFGTEYLVIPYMDHNHDHRRGQVKQNIHSIQLALERYATDMDGVYPYFLYGGELNYNIGTVNGINTQHVWRPYDTQEIVQPFDNGWIAGQGPDYGDYSWADIGKPDCTARFGDALQQEGYLPKYPRNPFARGAAGVFGEQALNSAFSDHACFGGRDGELSWNLAWYGEAPQMMFFSNQDYEPVRLEYEGSFSYLPRWSDGRTNSGHLQYQIRETGLDAGMPDDIVPPLAEQDMEYISSLDIAGYDLLGYGSERDKGGDLDVSILNDTGNHYWRSGYCSVSQGRNPWVTEGMWDGRVQVKDFDPRPFNDGVDDFVIIHLGSGLDRKIQTTDGESGVANFGELSTDEAGNRND